MAGSLRAQPRDARVVALPVAQRWLDCYGRQAREWLDEATEVARWWAKHWDLQLGAPLAGGSVSVVYAVRRAGVPAVLKLAAPWSRWSAQEALALRAWDGRGAARLLAACADGAALLLERVWPGRPAPEVTPQQLAAVVATLARPPVPAEMPSLSSAVALRFDRARENRHHLLSARQLQHARRAAMELAARAAEPPVLCHGDLSAKNILRCAQRGWCAIDPNPCAGHPAYDAAQWALTQLPVSRAPQRAAAVAAALGIPAGEVLCWIGVLAAAEACLASLPRARASFELAHHLGVAWVNGA